MNSITKMFITSKLDFEFKFFINCKNKVKKALGTENEQACIDAWWNKHNFLYGYLEGFTDAINEFPETREFVKPYYERLEEEHQDFLDIITVKNDQR